MLKKSVLYSALAIAAINPAITFAASQTNTTAPATSTSTQSDTTVTTPTTSSTQGDTTATTPTSSTTSNAQHAISDTEITNQIKALYQKSPLVNEQNITISTANQQVVLRGKVDTDMEYERAISLAESVAGVNDVNADNLLVKDSKSPLADTFITAKVKGAIMKEKLFGDKDVEYWPVSVETKNSVVYLAGNVDTNEQRTNIVNLVEKVKGVKSVKSSLTVNQTNNAAGQNNNAQNVTNSSE
ncbi:osmotically inducible protein Y [Legionella beliardensis]|uniref:Osmotically inducible protein Y n=1 Tax=Legionella beliardensis TaxID=91822 RepID=A0A378HZI2_9GAMM|nr:BON domain-containing protein [Legionella beliardensis]STX28339.1 osmotically inducible protein Y [Legionella beliardensis]